MRMIQISSKKQTEMSELCEEMLHLGGKLMQCIENCSMEKDDEYGKRTYYGRRYPDYNPMNMRDDEDWDDMDMRSYGGRMGMRQGVRGTGRYSRY